MKAALSCNAAFSVLQLSFSFVAAQLLVKMPSALQKSKLLQCNFCSASFRKLECNFVFAGGMLQWWGLEGWGFGLVHQSSSRDQKNVRNPNHHYFSKKYRNTPPICIAIRLRFVPQYFWCPYALRKGKYCQYSSHLYRSTPPICIAIRLPFVSQYFWENLGGCGHRNVPQERH